MSNWVSKLRGSGAPTMHTPQLLFPCMPPHAHTHPTHACLHACSSAYGHALHTPTLPQQAHPHAHLYPHACRSAWHMRPLLHLVFFSSSFFSTLVMNMVKNNLYLIVEKPQNFGYFFFCFFEIIVVLIDANDEQGMVGIASSEDDIIIVGSHIDQSGTGPADLPAQGLVLYSCYSGSWNSANTSPVLSASLQLYCGE